MKIKDIKKYAAGILAVSVLAFSFAGCTGDKNGSSSKPDSDSEAESSVSDESVPEEVAGAASLAEAIPEHNYENIKLFQNSGDKVYVFEQLNETTEREISSEIAVSGKKVTEKSLKAVDYDYIQFQSVNQKKIALAYCDKECIQHLCTIDRETGEKSGDIAIPEENYISILKNDGKDSFTALNIHYTEAGQEIHFEWFNENDLKVERDENLTEKLSIPDTTVISDAVAAPDGSLYLLAVDYKANFTTEYTLHRIDADGNVSYSSVSPENWKGYSIGLYINESGEVCLCNTEDFSQYYVYELKSETGELVKEHEIKDVPRLSNYVSSLSLPGYDFTFMGSAGIYGVSFETGKPELVLKFGSDLDTTLKNAFMASSFGDTLYMYMLVNEEAGSIVTAADSEGKEILSAELETDRGYASVCCVSDDGTVVYAETYDPGTGVETYSGTNNAYLFHVMDSTGKMKNVFSIAELEKLNDSTILSMRFGEDGNLYMMFYDLSQEYPVPYIYVSDLEGNFKGMFDGVKENVSIGSMFYTGKGLRALCVNENGDNIFMTFDLAAKELKEDFRTEQDDSIAFVEGKGSYPVYFMRDGKLYGCDPASDKETLVADTAELGADIMEIKAVSANKFLCNCYDPETGTTSIKYLNIE